MPRQARKLSRTGVYHVMLRGINRQDIFEDDGDYRQMTGCLRSLTERYDEMITRVPMIHLLHIIKTKYCRTSVLSKMETKVIHEIAPLGVHDFMYVADRHKQMMDYPIHHHDVLELNFVENATGCRRVVGDSSEVIDGIDLVLITSPDLEHVWEQHECRSDDIHEVTVQFKLDFESENTPFRTNPFKSIYKMMERAKLGLAFSRPAIMTVYHRLIHLSAIEENFMMAQELLFILHELSKYDDARELSSSSYAKVDLESESRRVLKVKNYIDQHYKDEIRLEQLADLVGMTPTAFSRYFKHRTGKNLSEYIGDIRLGYAARRLVDTSDTVAEICYCCGFNTLSNFNRQFRKRKGCNPTEFREKYCKTKVII